MQLRRGDRLLWSTPIGEPPTVAVEVLSPPTRGKSERNGHESQGLPGGEPAVLGLRVSRPTDPAVAYVKVVYRWAENGFHTAYLGPAQRRVTIDADRLPGGPRCEFFVVYSDGVRSAAARTKPIKVDPIGPVLTIVRPEADSTFPEGVPIDVECLVQHPESPDVLAGAEERTVWLLDGEQVASGALASIGPLAAGTHRIDVRYTGEGRRPPWRPRCRCQREKAPRRSPTTGPNTTRSRTDPPARILRSRSDFVGFRPEFDRERR